MTNPDAPTVTAAPDRSQRPLTITRQVGRLTVHALDAGTVWLDGGAMFGVVPKPLWERRAPPDARNRIPLATRSLLIEHEDGLVLVDTGVGNKETAKFRDIYGVDNDGVAGGTRLDDALRSLGYAAEDVRTVVSTHLHFDHVGGHTWRDAGGEIRPAFPRARYVVVAGELDYATHPNERTAASYFPQNWASVAAAGQLETVAGGTEIAPGIRYLPTPGHTPHHQSVLIESAGETLCFLADVLPTAVHLPLPWIMGYDVEPLVSLESKRALLDRAAASGWLLGFEHDPVTAWARLARDGMGLAWRDADD